MVKFGRLFLVALTCVALLAGCGARGGSVESGESSNNTVVFEGVKLDPDASASGGEGVPGELTAFGRSTNGGPYAGDAACEVRDLSEYGEVRDDGASRVVEVVSPTALPRCGSWVFDSYENPSGLSEEEAEALAAGVAAVFEGLEWDLRDVYDDVFQEVPAAVFSNVYASEVTSEYYAYRCVDGRYVGTANQRAEFDTGYYDGSSPRTVSVWRTTLDGTESVEDVDVVYVANFLSLISGRAIEPSMLRTFVDYCAGHMVDDPDFENGIREISFRSGDAVDDSTLLRCDVFVDNEGFLVVDLTVWDYFRY